MMWVAYCVIANIAIIATEYVNRHTEGNWAQALPYTIVPIIIAQFALFRAFQSGPSWLLAWGVFTVGNSLMRVSAISVASPDEVSSWAHVTAGVAIMLLGGFTLKEGLS